MDSLPIGDKQELERIMLKDLNDLHPSDIAFLNARRDYLNATQKETYKNFLRGSEDATQTPSEETTVPETPEEPTEPKVEVAQTQEIETPSEETTENPYDVDPNKAE